ncbi:hypothetical protein E0493_01775 [Roseomonas sp. M0104]|uniref:SGNH/GDSL hydrolase family protein n=1 Tax=Teichococcus coralli TaxID=2545983 RepID=A0A845B4G7_9PROT|nr:hypothetical protein [Pseudoroseomonas coralli]MXP62081.1 hypothetical protein [Pseudoroseomonas coralli]
MSDQHSSHRKDTTAAAPLRRPAMRFLAAFLLLVLSGIGVAAALHMALARKGLLPPPPLAATWCIDEKFAFLRETRLEEVTLFAIGSSATWRNLDMPLLERRLPGTRALNAAPCYLHIDQTAFMAGFLLERMPRVDTVLAVVAPRDFEACPLSQRAFFDPHLGGAYLNGAVPGWLPYVTGFRPMYLAREAIEQENLPPGPDDVALDGHGSSILRKPHFWRPAPAFDPACYEGLAALEEAASSRGARLVVATLPVMPEWGERFDRNGSLVESWTREMRAALRQPETLLLDGRGLAWGNQRFADPVHLLYPYHRPFTDFIASALARQTGS